VKTVNELSFVILSCNINTTCFGLSAESHHVAKLRVPNRSFDVNYIIQFFTSVQVVEISTLYFL
jgi:hypothetical protein